MLVLANYFACILEQSLENQSSMQRELLERDVAEIRRDWSQVQQIWQMIRGLLKGGIDKDVR